ncbi:hypothetical protein SAMN05421839_10648 [Halolactibacillus halophilus]|uniref:Uncharacterized protein n=1 Tax=Halolactibacillus halophilus TaxID=306540 RepID=A0A1I5MRQ9_9BACI|nr:hypothetical protein [Halolactibacillus halophilus]GEM01221.1 hypothetical protein HHA03_07530 [Halolactibacillus halophilus]SFP11651.1 hypothetical protein SAMN05421839_10648 [Halolactibacillus halophilus]
MNEIIKLQAFDVLLKRFFSENSIAKDKKFKVVLQIDNRLWTGDLINWNSNSIVEEYVDGIGVIDRKIHYKGISPFLSEIHNTSHEYIKQHGDFLRKLDDPRLIYNTLREIVDMIDFSDIDSEIDDVLYNPISLTDNIELPFLSLRNSEITLIAIKGTNH